MKENIVSKSVFNLNNRYIKKSDFFRAIYIIYGAYSIDSLLSLRDALNLIIKYKNDYFDIEEYISSLKGFVFYEKK